MDTITNILNAMDQETKDGIVVLAYIVIGLSVGIFALVSCAIDERKRKKKRSK